LYIEPINLKPAGSDAPTTAAGTDEVSATTAALFAAHTILLDAAAYTIVEDLRYY
jgi:hypothetical protein